MLNKLAEFVIFLLFWFIDFTCLDIKLKVIFQCIKFTDRKGTLDEEAPKICETGFTS